MFGELEYNKLHSIWDGKLSNTQEVCGSCGLCCSNSEKTLYPGEYDVSVKLSGQFNSLWVSKGCLCSLVPYKPVVCKLYPLNITVTTKGAKINWDGEVGTGYSTNCKKLIYNSEDRERAEAFVDYLFSDIDNRIFYLLSYSLHDNVEGEMEFQKANGQEGTLESSYRTAVYKTFLDTKICEDILEGWK